MNYPAERFEHGAGYSKSSECVDYILRMLLINGFVPVIWDTNDNFYSRTEYRIKSGADRMIIRQIANEIHGVTEDLSGVDFSDV